MWQVLQLRITPPLVWEICTSSGVCVSWRNRALGVVLSGSAPAPLFPSIVKRAGKIKTLRKGTILYSQVVYHIEALPGQAFLIGWKSWNQVALKIYKYMVDFFSQQRMYSPFQVLHQQKNRSGEQNSGWMLAATQPVAWALVQCTSWTTFRGIPDTRFYFIYIILLLTK